MPRAPDERCDSFVLQKMNFNPNWRFRGVPALVIRPKVAVPNVVPGVPNRGVFVK